MLEWTGRASPTSRSEGRKRGSGNWQGSCRTAPTPPQAVRQVRIPKKQPGKFRPLGIACIRERVAQTAALLVLAPSIEADLQPEQHAYRPGRSANDAVSRVHSLLREGCKEVVDGDLSNDCGEIPHAELLRSVARRVSDGRLLGWVKAGLERAVEEDDGKGGKHRTNRARQARKGTPQGAPLSPLPQQPLQAALHPGLEEAGTRRALPSGDRELGG